jgi:hypothetical protein
MDHSLEANGALADAKENHVVSDHSESCIRGKLRPKPIDLWLFRDFLYFGAKQPQDAKSMPGTIRGNEVDDLFQVAGHVRR